MEACGFGFIEPHFTCINVSIMVCIAPFTCVCMV